MVGPRESPCNSGDRLRAMPLALAVLTQCSLFSGLTPELTRYCAEHMRLVSLRRRETVSDGGTGGADRFTGLGVVLSGAVQAVDLTGDGREAALVTALPFECFGLAELLAPRGQPLTWMASATSTAVGVMERDAALQAFAKPELVVRAAGLLAQRVCDAQALQKVLTVHPINARVCAWLEWQQDANGGGGVALTGCRCPARRETFLLQLDGRGLVGQGSWIDGMERHRQWGPRAVRRLSQWRWTAIQTVSSGGGKICQWPLTRG